MKKILKKMVIFINKTAFLTANTMSMIGMFEFDCPNELKSK